MIKYSIITSLLLASMTFIGQGQLITIQGNIANAEGKYLKINQFINNQQVTADSALIGKKGKYSLSINASNPEFFSLMLAPEAYVLLALDSIATDKIVNFSSDATDYVKFAKLTGSAASSEILAFTKNVFTYQAEKQLVNQKMYEAGITMEERNQSQSRGDSLDKAFITNRDGFINRNSSSIASIIAIGYLNPTEDVALLRTIEQGLRKTNPTSEYYMGVQTQLMQIETQIKIQEEQEAKMKAMEAQTAMGAIAPELGSAFKSPTGEEITLASLKGKVVLIDFWASWCRPCRMENPNVVKMYNKYAKEGFTVYSVSLDKSTESWQQAIVQDGLIWPNHVSDLLQWQTAATKIYGFNGIPYTVLIDKEGKIIGKQLRGPALEEQLKEIFGY